MNQEELKEPDGNGVRGADGLTDEERAWLEAKEPLPSILDEYRHPLTGEILVEAGPDTPLTRQLRAEEAVWLAKRGIVWPTPAQKTEDEDL